MRDTDKRITEEKETEEEISSSRVIALVWFAVFCTSTASILTRYSTSPSLVLAAYRKTIVTLLLLPIVLGKPAYRREIRQLDRNTFLWCMLSGFFLAIHFWTYFLSVHNTTIAASQVLVGLEVLFVALIMSATGKESFSKWSRAGILVALTGGILVAYTKGGFQLGGMMFGNIIGIVSALMLACYSIIGTKVRGSGVSGNVYSFLVYGAAAAVLDLMVLVSPYHFTGYGAINYVIAFLMAVFNSLMGHSIFNWAIKYESPTLVAMIKIFQPVFSTTWAMFLFAELPTWNQFAGGVIVILGIFLYIRHKDE